jgi:holo-[acyl-carrier protein] synthase
MIKKIGIDIVANKRIKKLLKNEKFIKRILSDEELATFNTFTLEKRKVEYLAGRFAAKEALVKAIGSQDGEFNFNRVSVLNDADGTPIVKHCFDNLIIHVSISHENEYTVSMVIIEKTNKT